MRPAAARIWPQARRRARRSGDGGPPGRPGQRADDQAEQHGERGERGQRVRRGSAAARSSPRATAPQKKSVAPRPERTAAGHRDAPVAPVLGPADRLGPLLLQVGPGRAVEERRLQLAPAAAELDPGKRPAGRRGIARDRVDDGPDRPASAPACRRSRRPRTPSCRGRAPRRRSSRASRRPGARPGGCRRRARACGRPSPPARRPRAGCSRRTSACGESASAGVAASKSSWIISQSPSCVLFQSLKT